MTLPMVRVDEDGVEAPPSILLFQGACAARESPDVEALKKQRCPKPKGFALAFSNSGALGGATEC